MSGVVPHTNRGYDMAKGETCAYHDDTQKVLVELNTSSKWLVKLLAAAIVMGVPAILSMAVTFFIYVSKLETRVVTLEKTDMAILETMQQIKNQRNMDHKHSGFQMQ